MMNRLLLLLTVVCTTTYSYGQEPNDPITEWEFLYGYEIVVDLNKVKDDRVKVTVELGLDLDGEEYEYVMPKVIPGSYSVKDFGRFVNDFEARDAKNKKLEVEMQGNNVFVIKGAPASLEYWVDDTWDAPDDNFIFQPGGTNIQEDTNFVINHQGFYGYIEGHKMKPYRITYKRDKEMFCTTALSVTREKKQDVVVADNYVKLVDNPVMYCVPDTVSFMAGNMRVNISVHSYPKLVSAEQVKGYIEPLADALKSFFGTVPVDDYYFIMHFPMFGDEECRNGGFGALEHSYCSLYFLPYLADESRVQNMIYGVAAHEFLHILTPLNIHSEEIETFDFRDPDMSKHLWMYEGVTEYFANLVQVQEGLTDEDEFLSEMAGKIRTAATYADVSFTEMSDNILTDEYKEMYSNVYQKGALIGFMLDIRLRELSKGSMGMRELMLLLAEKYGPDQPFKDDELIDVITQLTYPEIGEFFKEHVEGDTPLPLAGYLDKLGWEYSEEKEVTHYTFGIEQLMILEDGGLAIDEVNKKQNSLGFVEGDVILEVKGEKVSFESQDPVFTLLEDDKPLEAEVLVLRDGEEVMLTGTSVEMMTTEQHVLEPLENPNEKQLQLRDWVLKR